MRATPGWQVISWSWSLALPAIIPAMVLLWLSGGVHDATAVEWGSLVLLGVSSMYLGFFAWYRGLSLAGIAAAGRCSSSRRS